MRKKSDIQLKKEIKRLLIFGCTINEVKKLLRVSTGLINTVKFNRKNSYQDKNTDVDLVNLEQQLTGNIIESKHITNNYNNSIADGLNNAGNTHLMTGKRIKHSNTPCNSILDIISNSNIPNPYPINTHSVPNTNTINNISSAPQAEKSSTEKNATLIKKRIKNDLQNVQQSVAKAIRQIVANPMVDQDCMRMAI